MPASDNFGKLYFDKSRVTHMLLAPKVLTVTLGRIGARQKELIMTNENEKNFQQSSETNPNDRNTKAIRNREISDGQKT